MLDWVTSWWSTDTFTGPARNAPNDGKEIKTLLDQCPEQVLMVTETEIHEVRKNLRKTQINSMPRILHEPPIIVELNSVFRQGNANYFEMIRKCRRNNKINTDTIEEFQKLSDDSENIDMIMEMIDTILPQRDSDTVQDNNIAQDNGIDNISSDMIDAILNDVISNIIDDINIIKPDIINDEGSESTIFTRDDIISEADEFLTM